jgi:broad specificity phosphatase PhoE
MLAVGACGGICARSSRTRGGEKVAVRIYVLRHGQTDWNADGRYQGQLDIPLNDTGRAQAARNGRTLAQAVDDPERFDFVSSPLSRATETMEIVRGELGLDPSGYSTDARLMEICAGAWQGRHRDFMMAQFALLTSEEQWHFVYPGQGGESYAGLEARVNAWMTQLERDVIVTTHGGVMRCVRKRIEQVDPITAFGLEIPQDKVLLIHGSDLQWL